MADRTSVLHSAKLRFTIWDVAHALSWPFIGRKTQQKAFWRGDRNPSLSIDKEGYKWYDHGTGKGGDQINLIAEVLKIDNKAACIEFLKLARGVSSNVILHKNKYRSKPQKKEVSNLPPLAVPGDDVVANIRKIRELPSDIGVREAIDRKILWYAQSPLYPDIRTPIWVMTDTFRVNAQARRLDGKNWSFANKPKSVVLTPPNGKDINWPIGCGSLEDENLVILVEGEGDLLAAIELAFMVTSKNAKNIGFCFLTGTSRSISERAVNRLKGRRVRIVPHADTDLNRGAKAGEKWLNQLKTAGINAEIFSIIGLLDKTGLQFKDLGEICSKLSSNDVSLVDIEPFFKELFRQIL